MVRLTGSLLVCPSDHNDPNPQDTRMSATVVVLNGGHIKSRSKDLIQSALRSASKWSCWRHRFSSVSSCQQVSWIGARLFGTHLQQLKSSQSRRHYTTTTTGSQDNSSIKPDTSTSYPSRGLKSTIRYDEAFFNLCRKRLEDKSDTSTYFMYCEEDPVRQAGVFMVMVRQTDWHLKDEKGQTCGSRLTLPAVGFRQTH